MMGHERLVGLKVVRPSDFELVATVADLPRKPDTTWLAYPKESQYLQQPLVINQTSRKLQPTQPNLLADDNVGLLFPAFSPGHDVYATHLAEALCLPRGIIVTKDGSLFSETFRTPKSYLQPDIYVGRNGLTQNVATGNFDISDNIPLNLSKVRLNGKSFFLDGDHFGSFGHMLAEILPRLWYLVVSGVDIREFTFVCGHSTVAALMPYLRSFGIDDSQLFFNRAGVVCERLYVATQGMIVRQSVSSAARCIWEHWRRYVPASPSPARIYISRANIPSRKMTNEEDVQAVFRASNFEIIYPEQLTFAQQIAAFANADYIAGPSGSNWFSIVFGKSKQSQMVLASENYIMHSEVLMRQPTQDRKLRFLVGTAQKRGEVHGPWSIDIDNLTSCLCDWLD